MDVRAWDGDGERAMCSSVEGKINTSHKHTSTHKGRKGVGVKSHADRQTDGDTCRQTDRQTDRQANGRTNRQTCRHMDGKTNTHTHTHTQREREREREKQILTFVKAFLHAIDAFRVFVFARSKRLILPRAPARVHCKERV